MSLRDLCHFSRTSKRFQALCENHFHRKYRKETTKAVKIRISADHIKVLVKPYYVKYFYNFIKSLKISASDFKQDKDMKSSFMANFVKT